MATENTPYDWPLFDYPEAVRMDTPEVRPVFVEPEYQFAGMTIGATNLVRCSRCAALLLEDDTDVHTEWHG